MARSNQTNKGRQYRGSRQQKEQQEMNDRTPAGPKNVYDMLRDKARTMGHSAAKLPDDAWKKFVDVRDKRGNLITAKLYVENYMMGNLEPAEFARVMAEDDTLRYTISDLCRERLEPTELNVQRNNSYIDVVAGAKTFWTEIRVPLPSEIEAARDLRNIYFGIEAGKAASGKGNPEAKPAKNAPETAKDKPEANVSESSEESPAPKRSFREMLSDARKAMAEKTIERSERNIEKAERTLEKLTAEKEEAWLNTDEGREYRDECTRKAAQHIENVVMNIEASKDKSLSPEDRKKALEAAGIKDDVPVLNKPDELFTDQDMEIMNSGEIPEHKSGYSGDELNQPVNDQMQELFDQIMQHVNQERNVQRGNGRGHRSDPNAGQPHSDIPETDEDLTHYDMGGGQPDPGIDDYYDKLAEDMASHREEDMPDIPCEEGDVELSAADIDALFEDEGPALGRG